MGEIRLNTPEELVSFLKILAEESIKSAKLSIEEDPEQKNIELSMQNDEKVFGPLDEEDPAEMPEPETDAEPEADPNESSFEVSLDSIVDAVKDLRSGRSVDDSRIKEQLRIYFDRLDSFERESMLAFFRAFAGILTGQFDATAAPDPSEEPYSITMTKGEDETQDVASDNSPDQDASQQGSDLTDDEFEEEEDEDVDDLEDTTPPIQTGGEQQLAEIRKRVKKLMIA